MGCRAKNKQGTFHCDRRFGHEESVGEIRAEAADGGAKATYTCVFVGVLIKYTTECTVQR